MTDVIDWPIIKDDVSRGGPLAMLLLGSAQWVHRRVDSLALGQSGTTRRSVSFDVTVPTDLQVPLTDAQVQVLVPLALIEKGALRRVTAKDPSGHPLPILGAQDNSRLSAEMLLFMLDATPGGLAAGYDAKLFALLQQVVAFQPGTRSDEERTRLEAGIADAAKAKGYPADVSELIGEIAKGFLDHFLLVAVLDSDLVGQRVVLKFSYDRDLPTPSPWNRIGVIDFTMPDVGFARSQHVEFEAPAGLIVKQLKVTETFAGEPVRDPLVDTPDEPRASAHVAFTPLRSTSGAFVRVRVAPAGAGILSFTVVAAVALAVFALFVAGEKFWGWKVLATKSLPSQAVSLILIGPALFLSWMARAPEHRTLATLLQPLRWILIFCTTVLIAAGVAVAFPLEKWARDVVWTGVPISAGAILMLLVVYLANAPRGAAKAVIRAGRFFRMLGVAVKDRFQSVWRRLLKQRQAP
ncbi:hypothetical protein PUN71_012125 [Arthrobacter sp. NQ7]|uniref:hypothetical protein n=1 Tax=Arthrobacter sp. NQ7 TaxID=3032303 RepID=UPI00240F6421|nr:hypothetical protein [Arthrobacter sp. NQ7]MDJ0457952.1 hypothetical protein [Arthrobacter sp. NQ7]